MNDFNIFSEAHKEFYEKLEHLPDAAKAQYRMCGGLWGLFKISSAEGRKTTLGQKVECIRSMVAGGISEHTIRMAFFYVAQSKGYTIAYAVADYEEQMQRFEWAEVDLATLPLILPPEQEV